MCVCVIVGLLRLPVLVSGDYNRIVEAQSHMQIATAAIAAATTTTTTTCCFFMRAIAWIAWPCCCSVSVRLLVCRWWFCLMPLLQQATDTDFVLFFYFLCFLLFALQNCFIRAFLLLLPRHCCCWLKRSTLNVIAAVCPSCPAPSPHCKLFLPLSKLCNCWNWALTGSGAVRFCFCPFTLTTYIRLLATLHCWVACSLN